MSDSGLLATDGWKERLYLILRAYAKISKVGYVAGMAYPAALLCAYNADDYEVWWAFMFLMKGKKIGLEKLYERDYEGLRGLSRVWRKLLSSRFRKVENNFQKIGLDDMSYTPRFFLHCFLGYPFPAALKLRIMDRFVLFGFRALLSLALGFVALNKQKLASGNVATCLDILNNLDGEEYMRVIEVWDKTWVDKSEYKSLLEKCDVSWCSHS